MQRNVPRGAALVIALGLVWVFGSLSIFATNASAMIFPPNDLHLEDSIDRRDANMTKEEFEALIQEAIDFYKPIAKKRHKAKLNADRLWEDSTVNAYAMRVGPLWSISMYGGLARRPEVTKDGFQLVVCHELGHLFGGYPFKKTLFGRFIWHTIEGEADYFATHSCARELWNADLEENAQHRETVDPFARQQCDAAWSSEAERDLCYRVADASYSLAKLLATLHKIPEIGFETPDSKTVSKTSTKHPAAQCRLDTYFAGALCAKAFNPHVIPGKKHAPMFTLWSASKAEKDAAKYSCHTRHKETVGVRPRCWFKPGV